MKKLLGILGTITIAGSGMSGIVGNAPTTRIEENNLETLKRIKREINSNQKRKFINDLTIIKTNLAENMKKMGEKIVQDSALMLLLEPQITKNIQSLGQYIQNLGIKMKEVGEQLKQITNNLIKLFVNVDDLGNGSISQGIILEKIGQIIILFVNNNWNSDIKNELKNDIQTIGTNIETIGLKLIVDKKLKYVPGPFPGWQSIENLGTNITNDKNGKVSGEKIQQIGNDIKNIAKNNKIKKQNIQILGQYIKNLEMEIQELSIILPKGTNESTNLFGHSLAKIGEITEKLEKALIN